jgi:AcrR family transcriptional regulator
MHVSHRRTRIVKGQPQRAVTGRTQAERRAATRDALIASARALFAERGYAGATREEIVERAGMTRGALYHHFASKEELFRAAYEAVEDDLRHRLTRAAVASGDDPVARLRGGALEFLDAAATPAVRRIALLDAPAVLPFEVRRELSERYGLGLLRDALGAIDAAGRLRVGGVDALAHVLLAALHEAATVVAEGGDRAEMAAVVTALLDLLCT